MVLPNGNNAKRISLKCCIPKGIPIMVIQKNIPHAKWVRAIGKPPTNHHITFIMPARHPDGQPSRLTFVPKGHNATMASFIVCRPNGIPIIVIIISKLEIAYSIAIIKPPKTIQIMLSKMFIVKIKLRRCGIFA